MRIVIGIISYLPDNNEIREHRLKSLKNLISRCNLLFNLPIYIVRQNYHCDISANNVTLSEDYSKLGILKARRKLREWFINSNYDYLIMLDDDCIIKSTMCQAKDYLMQIENNQDCFIEFNDTLLKLFAISKTIFKEVDYADINPENSEGFEDRIFIETLRKRFKDRRRIFKTEIKEESLSAKDEYSTWYTNQDLKEMVDKTDKTVAKLNE